ncbi:hypothetical protein PIB30_035422 [Stylosanthes scabra]|uniref:Aminotransferase-like plant mobile domain-containing protein n=1 Tax=Stylosanthes scabra TaxID=79078 RepID=A0ABU6RD71_9FABA|nr:hypothetical protein [Stylosanthes scabra]
MWLRERVRWTPAQASVDELRQYARCYILLMIGCWLFSEKSDNMVSAADRDTTDIAGCTPLIMSWIYQRFPRWCPDHRDAIVFPLVARLNGYQ